MGAVILAIRSSVANGGQIERVARAGVEPAQRKKRLSSHRGSGSVEVLSQTESGTRVEQLVTLAGVDHLADVLRQTGRAPILPAAEPGRRLCCEGLLQKAGAVRTDGIGM